ncbi:MAG: hypothetical protein AAB667_00175 [Patescibacteria group bacterium]
MDQYFKRALASIKNVPYLKPQWFWAGFSIGILYFGTIFWWMWSLHPLTTIGITNQFWSFVIVAVAYVGSVLPAAAMWGLFSWALFKIIERWGSHSATPFFAGGLFVLTEYLRAWVFGIVWAGSGSSLGPNWTFGNPAYWLTAFSPFAQSASWWGMYGIDFVLVVLIVAGIFSYKYPAKRQINLATLVTIAAVCGGAIIIGSQPNDGTNNIPVALIQTEKQTQPNYSGDEAFKDAQQKLKLIKEAATKFEKSGGIIILPEGSALSTFLNSILTPTAIQEYFRKLGPTEILIVDNVKTETSTGLVSRIAMISSRDGLIASKDKHVIAPGGEYVPFIARGLISVGNLLGLDFKRPSSIVAGSDTLTASKPISASLVACSDVFSTDAVRDKNASVILGVNSLALFRGSGWLSYQILAANKMRAIENRSWLAWASNSSHSYIITPTGETSVISKENGYGILTGSVVPRRQPAWYTYIGDWPVLLASFALVGISFRRHNAS